MLLKKQTVWLLTMLSLVVVLSVYYITSPEQKGSDFAAVQEEGKEKQDQETASTETEDGDAVISSTASDEVFESLRLKLDEERSKMKEELTAIVASTDLPNEKRNEAYDKIQHLDDVTQKESLIETLIVAMGYDDALVRADGEKVLITVKAEEPSASAANDIIQLVRTEMGNLQPVAVEFQAKK